MLLWMLAIATGVFAASIGMTLVQAILFGLIVIVWYVLGIAAHAAYVQQEDQRRDR